MGPTRELRGDKQKDPPSAIGHGLGGGSRSGPPFQFVRTGARPCVEGSRSSSFLVRPRPRARGQIRPQTWRCDAAENGGILRFSRIIHIMLSPQWQFPADLDATHPQHSRCSGSAHLSRPVAVRRPRPSKRGEKAAIRPDPSTPVRPRPRSTQLPEARAAWSNHVRPLLRPSPIPCVALLSSSCSLSRIH